MFMIELKLDTCGEHWDTINQFNPATLLCRSQTRTCISNVISRGLFYVKGVKGKGIIRFVEIGEIVDHHHLLLLNLYFSM